MKKFQELLDKLGEKNLRPEMKELLSQIEMISDEVLDRLIKDLDSEEPLFQTYRQNILNGLLKQWGSHYNNLWKSIEPNIRETNSDDQKHDQYREWERRKGKLFSGQGMDWEFAQKYPKFEDYYTTGDYYIAEPEKKGWLQFRYSLKDSFGDKLPGLQAFVKVFGQAKNLQKKEPEKNHPDPDIYDYVALPSQDPRFSKFTSTQVSKAIKGKEGDDEFDELNDVLLDLFKTDLEGLKAAKHLVTDYNKVLGPGFALKLKDLARIPDLGSKITLSNVTAAIDTDLKNLRELRKFDDIETAYDRRLDEMAEYNSQRNRKLKQHEAVLEDLTHRKKLVAKAEKDFGESTKKYDNELAIYKKMLEARAKEEADLNARKKKIDEDHRLAVARYEKESAERKRIIEQNAKDEADYKKKLAEITAQKPEDDPKYKAELAAYETAKKKYEADLKKWTADKEAHDRQLKAYEAAEKEQAAKEAAYKVEKAEYDKAKAVFERENTEGYRQKREEYVKANAPQLAYLKTLVTRPRYFDLRRDIVPTSDPLKGSGHRSRGALPLGTGEHIRRSGGFEQYDDSYPFLWSLEGDSYPNYYYTSSGLKSTGQDGEITKFAEERIFEHMSEIAYELEFGKAPRGSEFEAWRRKWEIPRQEQEKNLAALRQKFGHGASSGNLSRFKDPGFSYAEFYKHLGKLLGKEGANDSRFFFDKTGSTLNLKKEWFEEFLNKKIDKLENPTPETVASHSSSTNPTYGSPQSPPGTGKPPGFDGGGGNEGGYAERLKKYEENQAKRDLIKAIADELKQVSIPFYASIAMPNSDGFYNNARSSKPWDQHAVLYYSLEGLGPNLKEIFSNIFTTSKDHPERHPNIKDSVNASFTEIMHRFNHLLNDGPGRQYSQGEGSFSNAYRANAFDQLTLLGGRMKHDENKMFFPNTGFNIRLARQFPNFPASILSFDPAAIDRWLYRHQPAPLEKPSAPKSFTAIAPKQPIKHSVKKPSPFTDKKPDAPSPPKPPVPPSNPEAVYKAQKEKWDRDKAAFEKAESDYKAAVKKHETDHATWKAEKAAHEKKKAAYDDYLVKKAAYDQKKAAFLSSESPEKQLAFLEELKEELKALNFTFYNFMPLELQREYQTNGVPQYHLSGVGSQLRKILGSSFPSVIYFRRHAFPKIKNSKGEDVTTIVRGVHTDGRLPDSYIAEMFSRILNAINPSAPQEARDYNKIGSLSVLTPTGDLFKNIYKELGIESARNDFKEVFYKGPADEISNNPLKLDVGNFLKYIDKTSASLREELRASAPTPPVAVSNPGTFTKSEPKPPSKPHNPGPGPEPKAPPKRVPLPVPAEPKVPVKAAYPAVPKVLTDPVPSAPAAPVRPKNLDLKIGQTPTLDPEFAYPMQVPPPPFEGLSSYDLKSYRYELADMKRQEEKDEPLKIDFVPPPVELSPEEIKRLEASEKLAAEISDLFGKSKLAEDDYDAEEAIERARWHYEAAQKGYKRQFESQLAAHEDTTKRIKFAHSKREEDERVLQEALAAYEKNPQGKKPVLHIRQNLFGKTPAKMPVIDPNFHYPLAPMLPLSEPFERLSESSYFHNSAVPEQHEVPPLVELNTERGPLLESEIFPPEVQQVRPGPELIPEIQSYLNALINIRGEGVGSRFWEDRDITNVLRGQMSREEQRGLMAPLVLDSDDMQERAVAVEGLQVMGQQLSQGEIGQISLPVNLGRGHWVAVNVANGANGPVATFQDSLGGRMPERVRSIVSEAIPGVEFHDLQTHQQGDGYNCGPYTVSNLVSMARGENLTEERDGDELRTNLVAPLLTHPALVTNYQQAAIANAEEVRQRNAEFLAREQTDLDRDFDYYERLRALIRDQLPLDRRDDEPVEDMLARRPTEEQALQIARNEGLSPEEIEEIRNARAMRQGEFEGSGAQGIVRRLRGAAPQPDDPDHSSDDPDHRDSSESAGSVASGRDGEHEFAKSNLGSHREILKSWLENSRQQLTDANADINDSVDWDIPEPSLDSEAVPTSPRSKAGGMDGLIQEMEDKTSELRGSNGSSKLIDFPPTGRKRSFSKPRSLDDIFGPEEVTAPAREMFADESGERDGLSFARGELTRPRPDIVMEREPAGPAELPYYDRGLSLPDILPGMGNQTPGEGSILPSVSQSIYGDNDSVAEQLAIERLRQAQEEEIPQAGFIDARTGATTVHTGDDFNPNKFDPLVIDPNNPIQPGRVVEGGDPAGVPNPGDLGGEPLNNRREENDWEKELREAKAAREEALRLYKEDRLRVKAENPDWKPSKPEKAEESNLSKANKLLAKMPQAVRDSLPFLEFNQRDFKEQYKAFEKINDLYKEDVYDRVVRPNYIKLLVPEFVPEGGEREEGQPVQIDEALQREQAAYQPIIDQAIQNRRIRALSLKLPDAVPEVIGLHVGTQQAPNSDKELLYRNLVRDLDAAARRVPEPASGGGGYDWQAATAHLTDEQLQEGLKKAREEEAQKLKEAMAALRLEKEAKDEKNKAKPELSEDWKAPYIDAGRESAGGPRVAEPGEDFGSSERLQQFRKNQLERETKAYVENLKKYMDEAETQGYVNPGKKPLPPKHLSYQDNMNILSDLKFYDRITPIEEADRKYLYDNPYAQNQRMKKVAPNTYKLANEEDLKEVNEMMELSFPIKHARHVKDMEDREYIKNFINEARSKDLFGKLREISDQPEEFKKTMQSVIGSRTRDMQRQLDATNNSWNEYINRLNEDQENVKLARYVHQNTGVRGRRPESQAVPQKIMRELKDLRDRVERGEDYQGRRYIGTDIFSPEEYTYNRRRVR